MTIGIWPLRTLRALFSTGTFMTIGYMQHTVKSRQLRGVPERSPSSVRPGLASLSYGVRMGSGVFDAVWSTAEDFRTSSDNNPTP